MSQDNNGYEILLKNLGQNIRNARKTLKLSQEKLALELDSARNYIGCIERAEKAPSLKKLYDISQILNKKVEDLLSK